MCYHLSLSRFSVPHQQTAKALIPKRRLFLVALTLEHSTKHTQQERILFIVTHKNVLSFSVEKALLLKSYPLLKTCWIINPQTAGASNSLFKGKRKERIPSPPENPFPQISLKCILNLFSTPLRNLNNRKHLQHSC